MSNFHVGQKVVCVDAHGADNVIENGIYTIAGLVFSGLGVTLGEAFPNVGDVGFKACRFRPVVTRKTDIFIFRAMLNTTPETVGAE